ncbi:HAMP domain-containing protein [Actinokineospora sp. G85]|uniref:HAMP domain-containing protein n=1 Tax=Actinokineospora sp. G85 TaxID=3406626 RepID=UPI003C7153D6
MADDARRQPRRGRTLADQIPESGFPSGVGTPSAVVLVMLVLLAALTTVLLEVRDPGVAPAAVVDSERQLALSAGRAVGVSASRNATDLRTATAIPASPETLLAGLATNGRWRGLAVLDGATRALLAARGEAVPVRLVPAVLDQAAVVPTTDAGGRLTLVTALVLADNRVLVATSRTRLPDVGVDADPDRAVLVADATGRVLDARGTPPAATDGAAAELISLAAAAAAGGQAGAMLGDPVDGWQTVVTHAPVAVDGTSGELGLGVVAVARTPVTAGVGHDLGLLPGAALLGLALLGFLLIRATLVRPVRRLRADALAVAGGKLGTEVALSRVREVRRVAVAVEHCRAVLRETGPRAAEGRFGLPAVAAVSLAAALVLGWSATLVLTVATGTAEVPEGVATSLRNRTIAVTTTLRRGVNDGVADLSAVALLGAGKDPAALRPALEQLISTQSRYRSVYLVDANGAVSGAVGREPLRAQAPVPAEAGVAQEDREGPVPVLYAHVPMAGGASLVGEYDTLALTGLLDRAPGEVRVLDGEHRTILATGGYVAFERVKDDRLRTAAESARAGAEVTEVRDAGLVVSTQLRGGPSSALDWVVVADQPVADLALAVSELRRNALTVALIGALAALFLFAWNFLVLVRPLNRIGAHADAIAGGDTSGVVYPQHQDQIGTIASCLEICRQALTEGTGRLGEVRRPRGAATEATELVAPVSAKPRQAEATEVIAPVSAKPRPAERDRRGRPDRGEAQPPRQRPRAPHRDHACESDPPRRSDRAPHGTRAESRERPPRRTASERRDRSGQST